MKTTSLAGARVLMVMAHCDDEIVCGWPIMQDPAIHKTILMVSSDRYSTERQWCAHRKFVFIDLCKQLGVATKVLDLNSNFHATPSRGGGLLALEQQIAAVLGKGEDHDFVFTHNPFGEYGHHDHKYLFQATAQLASKPLIITDICMHSDWSASNAMTDRMRSMYFREPIGEARLDKRFYAEVKQKYELSNVWTWNQEPRDTCRLYLL
jgi:LmbE family N-acetylglucosaminyl deacetylase